MLRGSSDFFSVPNHSTAHNNPAMEAAAAGKMLIARTATFLEHAPRVTPHRTTGLKGRNIIAQGKGAGRRPPPWVATPPVALGAAARSSDRVVTFLPPVGQTKNVAVDRTAFVREFGSRIEGWRRMTCPTANDGAGPVNKEPIP